jgi:hypothetical protein
VNAPNPNSSVVVIDVTGVPKASTKYTKATGISVTGQGGLNTIPGIGPILQMLAVVTPATTTDKTVTWTVSDTSIASINSTGLLTAKKAGSVTVTATAKDGSDIFGQAKITVSAVSAISSLTSSSLKVYPNPANKGIVNLEYDNSSNLTSYSLVDILGKETLKGSFMNQITINLSNCKQVDYFAMIENNGKSEVRKLLVK